MNAAFAAAVVEELEQRPRRGGLLPRLPPLPCAAARPRSAAGRAALALRAHSLAAARTTGACCRSRCARAIHDGLLANDVVGFHTDRWRRNFLVSARHRSARTSTRRDRRARRPTTLVTAHPISVDPPEFDELAASDGGARAGARASTRIAASGCRPRRPHRSVEEHRPRLPGVRALARAASGAARPGDDARAARPVAPGHPASTPTYLEEIQRAARAVNERFGSDGWQPIALEIEDDFPRSLAAYKQYDVLFVNAVFDGLNLVAKEAPLVNERDGVLVLSENAGALRGARRRGR